MPRRHRFRNGLLAAIALLACPWAGPAAGQSLHFDVEIRLSNGPTAGSRLQAQFFGDKTLLIDDRPAIDYATGYGIWPANFGDLAGGAFATDNPGFQAFPGTFLSGERVFYRPLDKLLHRAAASDNWAPAPAGTQIRIEGTVPAEIAIAWLLFNDPSAQAQYDYYATPTLVTGAGLSGPPVKMVDEASGNGALHTHLNWFIEGGRPPGAYLVQLQLTDPGGKYADSAPFFVLFNHGLSDTDYGAALRSRIDAPVIHTPAPIPAVPEPTSLWMLMAALALFMAVGRRRSARA